MSLQACRGIGAALVAALSLFLGADFAGGTTLVPSDVQQTVTLPLTGVTHFIPPDSCRKAGWAEEDISWAGWIVIENNVGFYQGRADIQAKLALVDLVGVGHSSGWDYSSTGSFAMRSVPQVSVIAASLSGSRRLKRPSTRPLACTSLKASLRTAPISFKPSQRAASATYRFV